MLNDGSINDKLSEKVFIIAVFKSSKRQIIITINTLCSQISTITGISSIKIVIYTYSLTQLFPDIVFMSDIHNFILFYFFFKFLYTTTQNVNSSARD